MDLSRLILVGDRGMDPGCLEAFPLARTTSSVAADFVDSSASAIAIDATAIVLDTIRVERIVLEHLKSATWTLDEAEGRESAHSKLLHPTKNVKKHSCD